MISLPTQLQQAISRRFISCSSHRQSSLTGTKLTLDHFILRGRAISLWRDIVRATNRIDDASLRADLRRFAREEFERNRDATDIDHIRYLISTGQSQFKSMQGYIFDKRKRGKKQR